LDSTEKGLLHHNNLSPELRLNGSLKNSLFYGLPWNPLLNPHHFPPHPLFPFPPFTGNHHFYNSPLGQPEREQPSSSSQEGLGVDLLKEKKEKSSENGISVSVDKPKE